MRTILVRLVLVMGCAVGAQLATAQTDTPQSMQSPRPSESIHSDAVADNNKAGEAMEGDAALNPKAKNKKKERQNKDSAKQKQSYEDFYHDVFELNKTI